MEAMVGNINNINNINTIQKPVLIKKLDHIQTTKNTGPQIESSYNYFLDGICMFSYYFF